MKKIIVLLILIAGCDGNRHRILNKTEKSKSELFNMNTMSETIKVQNLRISRLEHQVNNLQEYMILQKEQDVKSLNDLSDLIESQKKLIKYLERKEKKRCR